MADHNLKSLHPEERIKRLKELEAQKKKEIEDGAKQIKESEKELSDTQKLKEKVPIPEVAKEEEEGLSEEGRLMLKMLRGKQQPPGEGKEEAAAKPTSQESLEETLLRENMRIPMGAPYELPREVPLPMRNMEYVAELSERPAEILRQEAQMLYRAVEDRGYMTWEEQGKALELYEAGRMKERAMERGAYTFTEEVAESTSLIKQLAGQLLHNAYQSSKTRERTMHDWYKGV